MRFPYSIAITPPTVAELSGAGRTWWAWAIGAGLGILGATVILSLRVEPLPGSLKPVLEVSSAPAGAAILIDGRPAGHTPADLALPPGDYQISLARDGYVGVPHAIALRGNQTASVDEELWLRTPQVQRIQPVFPGASVTDASFLNDGTLALTVALRPGDEQQLWLRDREGTLRRTGPPLTRGPLVVSPDGRRTAYLAQGTSARTSTFGLGLRLDELWVTGQDDAGGQRLLALDAGAVSERLVDLRWAPDGHHLLTMSRLQQPDGSLRARFLVLDSQATERGLREFLRLPGDVVPASLAWSPDGRWAAFQVRTGQRTALCVVGVEDGTFRYLADLGADAPSPFPFTPVAWSPDGRQLLYAAPSQGRSSQGLWPLGAKSPPALYVASPADSEVGRLLRGAQGPFPIWRGDGTMLALARPKSSGPLTLRAITPSGQTHDLTTLSLPSGTVAAVRWDVTHAQAFVAVRRADGLSLSLDPAASQLEYWLVRFRTEGEEAGQ
ncbi:MAG: PEGA domain-containing protein [Chloroflexi bacterium]|nr:PEGA domain-containing protein [Chloroflexota bacterium]